MNKYFKIMKTTFLFMLISLILSGCSGSSSEMGESDNLQVYTSIYPIYEFATQIGGEYVDVYKLIQNGEDAHSFEPTAKDIMNLENSDVLFFNGAGLETWVDSVKSSISNEELKFVNLSEYVELIGKTEEESEESSSEYSEHDEHNYDPHIWLSPLNAITIATTILETFIELDPDNEDYYTNNCRDLVESLANLHLAFNNELSELNNNEILVTHNAYGYLCKLYGIKQTTINDSNESDEVSPAKLIEIINYINENNIKYIITDGISSEKVAENIVSETGAEILTLNTLESLTDKEIKAGKSYISIMYENLETLKVALS